MIAVTQSGETADTLAPTRLARERGCPIVAVTNTVGSAITREAHRVLFLQAGPEIAVAASKTFVTQVTTLVVLAAAIAKARAARSARSRSSSSGRRSTRSRTRPPVPSPTPRRSRNSPAATSTRVGSCSWDAATATRRRSRALKLKEVSYVHAEGYAAGEMKHGPISLLDAECPLVAVATRSSVYDKLVSNVMEGRARATRGSSPSLPRAIHRSSASPTTCAGSRTPTRH